jgi:hypothetical protein
MERLKQPQPITGQGIGAALQNNGAWLENFHNFGNHWAKNTPEGFIIHTIIERKVNGVILAIGVTDILNVSRSREIFPEFVKRDSHDAVCGVECLFDSISVMDDQCQCKGHARAF